jgi:hypothetical protein
MAAQMLVALSEAIRVVNQAGPGKVRNEQLRNRIRDRAADRGAQVGQPQSTNSQEAPHELTVSTKYANDSRDNSGQNTADFDSNLVPFAMPWAQVAQRVRGGIVPD